jgi:ATP phosphoribosyltransferase regulatory subunit
MSIADRWLLPDGIEELLPAQAARAEQLRSQLLKLYRRWGYALVIPPLVEFTDSLLVSGTHDLDLQTCKVTDQLSGRLMGVRADITPQAARIDAHGYAREGATRLCYAGSVLHARPKTALASRSPIQIGCELYGSNGVAADCEVIGLMLETARVAGIQNITLDLGHVDIVRGLTAWAALNSEQEQTLFDILQRKANAELQRVRRRAGVSHPAGSRTCCWSCPIGKVQCHRINARCPHRQRGARCRARRHSRIGRHRRLHPTAHTRSDAVF